MTSNGRWPQKMKIQISQQPLIRSSTNFKHKLIVPNQSQKMLQWRRPSFEDDHPFSLFFHSLFFFLSFSLCISLFISLSISFSLISDFLPFSYGFLFLLLLLNEFSLISIPVIFLFPSSACKLFRNISLYMNTQRE